MTTADRNLFIIGPMGVGKTTIGRSLAKQLKLEFIDSDQEIEARAGANIAWIFDVEGEQGFRQREVQVIEELTQRQGILLATGGGAILRAENRACLKQRGLVIFLDTSLDVQLRRTAKDKKRPLLQTPDPAETLRRLKAERDPLYNEVADLRVEVGDISSRRTHNQIVKKLEELQYPINN